MASRLALTSDICTRWGEEQETEKRENLERTAEAEHRVNAVKMVGIQGDQKAGVREASVSREFRVGAEVRKLVWTEK